MKFIARELILRRLEKWENGTEKMEVFRKRPKKEKKINNNIPFIPFNLVRFPDPPYGVGRENEPPRSWEFYFGAR